MWLSYNLDGCWFVFGLVYTDYTEIFPKIPVLQVSGQKGNLDNYDFRRNTSDFSGSTQYDNCFENIFTMYFSYFCGWEDCVFAS